MPRARHPRDPRRGLQSLLQSPPLLSRREEEWPSLALLELVLRQEVADPRPFRPPQGRARMVRMLVGLPYAAEAQLQEPGSGGVLPQSCAVLAARGAHGRLAARRTERGQPNVLAQVPSRGEGGQ